MKFRRDLLAFFCACVCAAVFLIIPSFSSCRDHSLVKSPARVMDVRVKFIKLPQQKIYIHICSLSLYRPLV